MQLNDMLTQAKRMGSSDVHLTVGSPPVFRVHGKLAPQGREPLMPPDVEELVKQLLNPEQLKTLKERGEVDGSMGIPGVSRFRFNCYQQRSCWAIAVRIIPDSIPSIDELGFPKALKELCKEKQGLILVTGPTGSGKSTTLASMVHEINMGSRRHVVTLEHPIEYLHKHMASLVNQREVGFDTNSFAAGLRAALRQDPDVILVGEMRDLETVQTVITAAETGHLVLATLHTLSAAATIERVVDVFPPEQQAQVRSQLATILRGVISQRLFTEQSHQGRVAALEILLSSPGVANLIRQGKIHQLANQMQAGRGRGMQTMQAAVAALVRERKISQEDAAPYMGMGMGGH